MSAKFSRIHHLLQTCLWVCLCVVCSAYTTAFSLDSWLSEFVQLRVEQKDSAMPLMRITEHYRSLKKSGQKEMRDKLTVATSSYLTQNKQEEALAVIDLYNFMVTEKDASWSRLNFVKGNIAAERNDTLTLKRIISELESIEGDTYAPQLNKYLRKIRNFIPADKGLSGYWVSDNCVNFMLGGIYLPEFMIQVTENGENVDFKILSNSAGTLGKLGVGSAPLSGNSLGGMIGAFTSDLMREAEILHSKMVLPIAQDSIYILWSSENLKKGMGTDATSLVRQATGELSAKARGYFSQSNKFSFAEQLTGSMFTGFAEMGLNALWDHLSEPTKRISLTEARLKRVSDYELQGTLFFRKTKIKASDTTVDFDEEIVSVRFYRWFPECDYVFMKGTGEKRDVYPYAPNDWYETVGSLKSYKKKREKGLVNGIHWKEAKEDTTRTFGKAYLKYKSIKKKEGRKEFLINFNADQLELIQNYAQEQARLKKEEEEE